MIKKLALSTCIAIAAVSCITEPARAQQPQQQPPAASDVTVSGITKPMVQSELSLSTFGIVLELPVKQGQAIKKGDVLLRQDDRQEQAALEELELEANSSVRVDASAADLKLKQVQLARYKEMFAKRVATASELEEAEMKVVYAEAQVKLAELERAKAALQAKRQKVKVDQMKLVSEIDGFVHQIEASVGEICDPQKPVMVVVQNDPVLVEFYLPARDAAKLQPGQQVDVRYPGEEQWRQAKVTYRAPMADRQSFDQQLELELPNPEKRDTGMSVQVRLPAGVAPAGGAGPEAAPAAAATPARVQP